MRLKLFRAPGISEAMAQIRAALGPDALILSTRRVADGVEVTAALEAEEPELVPPVLPPRAEPPAARSLAWHGVPAELTRLLADGSLAQALAAALCFGVLPLGRGGPPLLFVGPPGAGKTLTVARLATRLVLEGTAPLVISADGQRAGAAEQLAAFTRLLGINLIVASQPVTLCRALTRRETGAPVLIDAPGADLFDPAERENLAALAEAAGAAAVLVLPAGLDPAEAAELAAAAAEVGAGTMVATRLDLARRLGGVLAAGWSARLTLTEAGIGPGASDGLAPLTPAFLADRLSRTPTLTGSRAA